MAASTYTSTIAGEKGPLFKVLHSTSKSQAAIFTIAAGKEAGEPDSHAGDQWMVVWSGRATILLWNKGKAKDPHQMELREGGILLIPGGMLHHVRSTGKVDLVAVTFYAPAAY